MNQCCQKDVQDGQKKNPVQKLLPQKETQNPKCLKNIESEGVQVDP
jgi:hypothetical protein